MRLKFEKNKQKEILQNFRKEKHILWKEFAKRLNIPFGRLKAYVDETSLISREIYEKIDPDKKYSRFLLEEREENWGKKKGGKNSAGNTKTIIFPRDSETLSEFYGIMLGDGNSHRTKSYKKGTYMIRIVGDSKLDKDYLVNYVKPLIEGLFGIQVSVRYFKNKNAIYLESHSRELILFLEGKGFPPGNKIKNCLRIPSWVKNNPLFLSNCIRGLFDTDGSVYKITNQNSYQINFTNYNLGLLMDVRNGLIALGISCSQISKGNSLYITKKSELRKFLKAIGFCNPRHINKIKEWKLAPWSSGQ